jgi:threonine dehydrogenase-like Zn-dependent dehydrogenase
MSGGKASAVWYEAPGVVGIRTAALPDLQPGFARVRTLVSGISRGTERLVSSGGVPEAEWARMRAPLQEGDFPFPVKYGYCAVGVVEAGPEALIGQPVFCLHPHQDRFVAPLGMLAPVPGDVPPRRATLAANMETALNAMWDSGAGPADRIVVVGGGVVGLLVGFLASRLPGAEVWLCDTDPSRATVAEQLGVRFLAIDALPGDADVVFHASASSAGLETALSQAGMEACVVEMSWYGDRRVQVGLGGAFHSRRLRIIGSQVGMVAPARRVRWTYGRRMAAALSLLRDPCLDVLVEREIAFADVARALPALLAPGAIGLAPVIRYPGAV